MKVLLIGLSHKTAPVAIREQLSFSPASLKSALTHFDTTHHQQAHLETVMEGVILSTCNRMEVYATVRDPQKGTRAIIDLLSRACDTPASIFAEHLYMLEDEQAIRHLFRVACGLDSMVLGEPQILGQITDAYEAALSQKAAGTVLSGLFRAAIHAGKRVRTETRISVNPASVSSVAAGLAQQLLGDLTDRQVALIGAGEMGAVAVRALIQRGVSEVTVVNRTYERAQILADAWGGKAATFQHLPRILVSSDVIIVATGAPHIILTQEMVEQAMNERPQRPLFLIDIAVPRDIDPDVRRIPNVFLRDIDDLQSQVDDNVRERASEIPLVEQIVVEEVTQAVEWLMSLDVVSTITDLRGQIEELRQMELDRLFNKLDLDERERELIATMSHRLVNKILHKPTLQLKHEAVHGNGAEYASKVRRLFDLEPTRKPATLPAKPALTPQEPQTNPERIRQCQNLEF
ncbi:MAG: glutamyl-tRNA reductase [Anaerolineae bacterium]|nr:glutamyl-tRNA reductase [Anaerolineae bacterium]MCB9106548.1 glutamyl-tRNA reductase [Anaerolineales bacterium]